ncbi:hypothetical protein HK405_015940, partial [Cladochytrium tenue]
MAHDLWLLRRGVVVLRYAALAYFATLSALIAFPDATQPYLVYMAWLRVPSDLHRPEQFGFRGERVAWCVVGGVLNFKIVASDNVTLGAWHILPDTAAVPIPGGRGGVTSRAVRTPDQFAAQLRAADRVVLYFHGNGGNRA